MHGARPAPTKDSSLCSTTDTFVLLLLYFHSHRSSLTGWHIKYRLIQTHYCISRAEQRHTFPCIRLYCLPLLSTVYFTSLHSITTTTFVVAASFPIATIFAVIATTITTTRTTLNRAYCVGLHFKCFCFYPLQLTAHG